MEGKVVARQQYYSNYGSYGRRNRVKPQAYIIFTLVAFILKTEHLPLFKDEKRMA